MDLLLLRAGLVAVGELGAEFEHRAVGPVFREVERRGGLYPEFVLILVPDADLALFAFGDGLDAVVAEFGARLGLDREFVLGEDMIQKEGADRGRPTLRSTGR